MYQLVGICIEMEPLFGACVVYDIPGVSGVVLAVASDGIVGILLSGMVLLLVRLLVCSGSPVEAFGLYAPSFRRQHIMSNTSSKKLFSIPGMKLN